MQAGRERKKETLISHHGKIKQPKKTDLNMKRFFLNSILTLYLKSYQVQKVNPRLNWGQRF